MQHNIEELDFILGDRTQLQTMPVLPSLPSFSDETLAFFTTFSRLVLHDEEAKAWPDVISLGFWCRKASVAKLRAAAGDLTGRPGRGVAFHIAPGNIATNFAYSLFTGLLTGNANIVRIPGRNFPQIAIIIRLLKKTLISHTALAPYICLVRYGHQQAINNALSALCDTRIIWGGDNTIARLRHSPLKPRALDIAFSDRYSIAVIHADRYLAYADKAALAQAFYNDTLLNDQNACSTPSLVIWLGQRVSVAREKFWQNFHHLVRDRYRLEPVAAVEKLARFYRLSAQIPGIKKIPAEDNLVFRVELPTLNADIFAIRGNRGFFLEYVADTLADVTPACGERCQTLAVFGIERAEISEWLEHLRPKGVDRVVALGQTLDFTLHWDGYDLVSMLTRIVSVAR